MALDRRWAGLKRTQPAVIQSAHFSFGFIDRFARCMIRCKHAHTNMKVTKVYTVLCNICKLYSRQSTKVLLSFEEYLT